MSAAPAPAQTAEPSAAPAQQEEPASTGESAPPAQQPEPSPTQQPAPAQTQDPDPASSPETSQAPAEKPDSEQAPAEQPTEQPTQSSQPANTQSQEPAEEPKKGIHKVVGKAQEHGKKLLNWIGDHKLEAGLIGAGVTIGALVAGWAIFRAIKARKAKKGGKNRRHHSRSFDEDDEFTAEVLDSIEHHWAQRNPIEGIDLNDKEFLEFLESLENDFSLE